MNVATSHWVCLGILGILLVTAPVPAEDEPPALNPFAARNTPRDDAQLGFIELSNGSIFPGTLFLTRDTRLRIYDEQLERQRDVPLRVIRKIVCKIEKEWMEREWRFKANAHDEKIYSGRQYPAREYRYEITLKDDRTISGSMSGIIYVSPYEDPQAKPAKFLMHKRDKGPVDTELDSLVFLKQVELGEEAMRQGQFRRTQHIQQKTQPKKPATSRVPR